MSMLSGTLGLWDFSVAWDRYIWGKINICICCLGLWDFHFTWDYQMQGAGKIICFLGIVYTHCLSCTLNTVRNFPYMFSCGTFNLFLRSEIFVEESFVDDLFVTFPWDIIAQFFGQKYWQNKFAHDFCVSLAPRSSPKIGSQVAQITEAKLGNLANPKLSTAPVGLPQWNCPWPHGEGL